jgi:hypothetical protein
VSPKAVALIAVLIAVTLVALIVLTYWLLSRQAGVRRREYKRMQTERNLALKAIRDIEVQADQYRDLESVLAAEIRRVTRELDDKRMELSG